MKTKDLKTKTVTELQNTLIDLKKKLLNLRFRKTNGEVKNTAEIRMLKRSVATVKTFLNQASKLESK